MHGIFTFIVDTLPNFKLSFENSPSTETLDYVLLEGFSENLKEVPHIIDTQKCELFNFVVIVYHMFLDAIR